MRQQARGNRNVAIFGHAQQPCGVGVGAHPLDLPIIGEPDRSWRRLEHDFEFLCALTQRTFRFRALCAGAGQRVDDFVEFLEPCVGRRGNMTFTRACLLEQRQRPHAEPPDEGGTDCSGNGGGAQRDGHYSAQRGTQGRFDDIDRDIGAGDPA